MVNKTIKQDGSGDFTTIQAFLDWIYATYGTKSLPDSITGTIQDSGTYVGGTLFASVVNTEFTKIVLKSNATTIDSMPTITNTGGTGINANGKWISILRIKFIGNTTGFYTTNPGTSEIISCVFKSNTAGYSSYYIGNYAGNSGQIYGSLFYSNTSACQFSKSGSSTNYFNIKNCTFYNNNYCIRDISSGYAFLPYWYDFNNIYYVRAGHFVYTPPTGSEKYGLGNYNTYYIESGGSIMSSYTTLSQWQAYTGGYINCIEQDPLFVNAATEDFRLSDNSPSKECANPAYIYTHIYPSVRYMDIMSADFDSVTCSCGCHQNLSVLVPDPCINIYPLGKTVESTTPPLAFRRGARDTGGYGSSSGTAQFRLALCDFGIKALLNGALSSSATTITFDGGVGTLPSSGTVLIEDEMITYSGKSATQLTGCTRGANGSRAVAHNDNVMLLSIISVKDSWANGTFYDATLTWKYSADYVSNGDPDVSGTWSALGTGDPSSSGVEGTNGVSLDPADTRYVKVNGITVVEDIEYYPAFFAYSGVIL